MFIHPAECRTQLHRLHLQTNTAGGIHMELTDIISNVRHALDEGIWGEISDPCAVKPVDVCSRRFSNRTNPDARDRDSSLEFGKRGRFPVWICQCQDRVNVLSESELRSRSVQTSLDKQGVER